MTRSGDRHLMHEPSGVLSGLKDGPRTILVRAQKEYARTYPGQVLLGLLVNLLARQFGVVDSVLLEIPSADVDPRAFPRSREVRGDLLERLIELGRSVSGDEVTVRRSDGGETAQATLLVGRGLEPTSQSPFTLVACGTGWTAFCSSHDASPVQALEENVPFGPLLAAALSAGILFLHWHGVVVGGTVSRNIWTLDPDGGGVTQPSTLEGLSLPPAYVVGLGAVGAAFSYALAAAPGLSGQLVGIDYQTTDETGRNRLLSAFYDDLAVSKVELARGLFEGTGIGFYANPTRWPDYAADPSRSSPPSLRVDEDAFRYKWMISCVDRNLDRRNIARYLPRQVLSGSTNGLVAQATYYAFDGECECLACNHPIPTFDLDEMVLELKALTSSQRLARYDALGATQDARAAIEEYLAAPSCGHVAEAELRRLGVEGSVDWSVGFVSAAAGIMLAALFVQCAIRGVAPAIHELPERRIFFMRDLPFANSRARRKQSCELCSSPDTQARFARRWGSS